MSRLHLDVAVHTRPNGLPHAALEIRVDGRDVLGDAWEGRPGDPDDLLGGDPPQLLPESEPHVVVGRICGCGEVGCGALGFRIRVDGDGVVWDQFQSGYVRDEGFETDADLDLEAIHFARSEYEAEVRRQAQDRRWEWPERTTARLVRERCRARPELIQGGWRFKWSSPWVRKRGTPIGPGVTLMLGRGDAEFALGFDGPIEDPVAEARRILAEVEGGDESSWPVVLRRPLAD